MKTLAQKLTDWLQEHTEYFSVNLCNGQAYGCYIDNIDKEDIIEAFTKIIEEHD